MMRYNNFFTSSSGKPDNYSCNHADMQNDRIPANNFFPIFFIGIVSSSFYSTRDTIISIYPLSFYPPPRYFLSIPLLRSVKTQRFCHHKIQRKCHHDFSFLTFSIIMLYEGGFYIGQKRSY